MGQYGWRADRAWSGQARRKRSRAERYVSATVAERIDQVAAEFAELEPRERLELLLEFSEKLPELPERLQAERDAGIGRVHECQTPVFLWVETPQGRVQIYADVAPEAPTVKGFVSVLDEVF